MTVSGLTMTSADRQSGQTRHSHVQKSRSDDLNLSRFTERWRTPSLTKREDLQLKGRAAADRQDKGRKKCCENVNRRESVEG